jgi:hypothetical protein
MEKRIRISISALLVAVVCLAVVAQVIAQPSPFVISCWVNASGGEPCNKPRTDITNTNTSQSGNAENQSTFNYYQLVLNGSRDVSADNLPRFNASGCGQSKTEEHAVTQDEMDNGGFMFNISLAEPQEIIWQGDVTLINGTTFNVTAHNSETEYAVNSTTALGALDAAAEAGEFNYTVTDKWGFLFVDSIADIPNEGWNGWMYWVNYPDDPMPMVGATDYAVEEGDIVTWYWSSSMEMTPEDSPKVLIINVTVSSNEFDTGEGTYPCISGTHYGKITPDQNITVNRIYTYSCAGTGGHSEYVKIWNETIGKCAVADWNGYQGDYHNRSFNTTLNLQKGIVYSYIIETGSYPQIIHAPYKHVNGGNVTCTRFEDANGKEYEDWIPAFRLWYAA